MQGETQMDIIVWCADIGSVKGKKFGWCRSDGKSFVEGTDIVEFCRGIAKDLSAGIKVALGLECPLFVPVSENPLLLTSSRYGEGDRAWSARAGCGALCTGLTESVFILNEVYKQTSLPIQPTFKWNDFLDGQMNLFLWEAFVSKEAKGISHSGDAKIAVQSFMRHYPKILEANAVTVESAYNLVAGAMLRTGLSQDIKLLSEPCIVIKG